MKVQITAFSVETNNSIAKSAPIDLLPYDSLEEFGKSYFHKWDMENNVSFATQSGSYFVMGWAALERVAIKFDLL